MAQTPFLTIGDYPVCFSEDWSTGLGGGLWSTGSAMGRYFATEHAAKWIASITGQKRISVIEIGSGNGFLAVCLAALFAPQNPHALKELAVTDFSDHLGMIKSTIDANEHIFTTLSCEVAVFEHRWGEFLEKDIQGDSLTERVQAGQQEFDLIIGSDVAYREELYDPLIADLQRFSGPCTVSLIGVTMNDTTSDFFARLREVGFCYYRLSDHLMEPEYRGRTFGIFYITRK